MKSLLGLVMLVYLVGTFHHGVFEVAHVVSHQLSGEDAFHTHENDGHSHSHGDAHEHDHDHSHDHEHTTLNLTEKVFDNFSHTPADNKTELKHSLDKLPQICHETNFSFSQGTSTDRKFTKHDSELPNVPFLSILSPPPEFLV